MLRGAFEEEALEAAIIAVLGKRHAFVPALVRRVIQSFGEGRRPRRYRLQQFLRADDALFSALKKMPGRLQPEIGAPVTMQPMAAAKDWPVPVIEGVGELMRKLRLNEGELLWLADPKSWEIKAGDEQLRNYRYRWQRKKNGGARLIEAPKVLLKSLQRRVLAEILDRIPAHEAAHGFRAGRSICSFAAPHVNREVLLRLDLRDFFVSIPKWRVISVFLAAGYPEAVAVLLAGLCTNATPAHVLDDCPSRGREEGSWHWRKRHSSPHLPQGAPTSPALANLCAYHLDCRLSGLARACGASYTRYADDMLFSGGDAFARGIARFSIKAAAIAMEEGFQVNMRKTKVMRRSVSQSVAGLVVKEKLNVRRAEVDQLKAILHNCLVKGPHTQNRDGHADFRAHLAGRIAHVGNVSPERGARLKEMLERVVWE